SREHCDKIGEVCGVARQPVTLCSLKTAGAPSGHNHSPPRRHTSVRPPAPAPAARAYRPCLRRGFLLSPETHTGGPLNHSIPQDEREAGEGSGMPTARKESTVAELKDLVQRSSIVIGAEYRGLSVREM